MARNAAGARPAVAPAAPDVDVAIDWLYLGVTVQITRYRCLANLPGLGGEQRQPAHVIGFPYKGVFELHQGRDRVIIEPGSVLFLNNGAPYCTSHPCGNGDYGSAIAVRPDILVEALARHDPAAVDRPEAPFRFPSGTSSPRTYLLQRLLFLRISREEPVDSLAVEETALALVDDVAAAACSRENEARVCPAPGAHHRKTVDAVRAFLANRFCEPLSLAAVGEVVGVSPFHLCRVFRAVTGITVSRYRHRLRLRAALERVASAEADLSAVALDHGYSSHSHFTAAFHREFGMTPTQFRQAAGRSRRNAANPLTRARC